MNDFWVCLTCMNEITGACFDGACYRCHVARMLPARSDEYVGIERELVGIDV